GMPQKGVPNQKVSCSEFCRVCQTHINIIEIDKLKLSQTLIFMGDGWFYYIIKLYIEAHIRQGCCLSQFLPSSNIYNNELGWDLFYCQHKAPNNND
ncbi:hypothetical protein ACJX0J_011390, partial [Zea mays]